MVGNDSWAAAGRRIGFCVAYFAAWMLYFAVLRLAFLLYHLRETEQSGLGRGALALAYGARIDMAATAYPAVLVFAFTAVSLLLPAVGRAVVKLVTGGMLLLLTLIAVIDLELFRVWGFRIDGAILRYLNTPREMFASAGASPIVTLVLILALLLALAAWWFTRLFGSELAGWQRIRWYAALPTFALLGGLCWFLYYPARGGFQKQPMTQSTVYFSRDAFANQAAINAGWNFFDSVWWRTYDTTNAYRVLPPEQAKATVSSLLARDASSWAWFTFTDGWGLVTDSGAVAWDNIGRGRIASLGKVDSTGVRAGQSLLQMLVEDYVSR